MLRPDNTGSLYHTSGTRSSKTLPAAFEHPHSPAPDAARSYALLLDIKRFQIYNMQETGEKEEYPAYVRTESHPVRWNGDGAYTENGLSRVRVKPESRHYPVTGGERYTP